MSMHIGIIGAGIVGLALARHLAAIRPDCTVTVLEKEQSVARHQTGHNSGVVHAGLYYKPGSMKATFCSRGRGMMKDYCQEKGIEFQESGKLVVAVSAAELPGLREIERRSRLNGVPDLRWLDSREIAEIEPHAVGVAALHSPHTARVDFVAVARAIAEDVAAAGGQLQLGTTVRAIRQTTDTVQVMTDRGPYAFDRLVICAGLQTDRISQMAGSTAEPRIVPFLGMYYDIADSRRDLVKSLIYPVPDPRYPFLGVHLTRTASGELWVGPNAVLGLARERYRALSFNPRDMASTVTWPGFYRMAAKHWRAGAREMYGAVVKRAFVTGARRYVPELTAKDFSRGSTGVRAQAVGRDGKLFDDFALDVRDRIVAVRNAPSPAATSSFAIAEFLAERALG